MKIVTVKGEESGRSFTNQDINNKVKYDEMISERLIKDGVEYVIPVRGKTPHFRTLVSTRAIPIFITDKDETHNECINDLYDMLNDNNFIKFYINSFRKIKVDDKEVNEYKKIFLFEEKIDKYQWFKEKQIHFSDGTYIQPDLLGRSLSVFAPTTIYPNIIIEVIRTHEPNKDTLKKLIELSMMNYIVIFYYILEDSYHANYNSYNKNENHIRFSSYLINGNIYSNDFIKYGYLNELKNFNEKYNDIQKNYFKYYKDNVKKLFK
jgi:hypothetical protein